MHNNFERKQMTNKISALLAMTLLLYATGLNAMPREQEHAECLKKATTDAEVTKCRETQIKAVEATLAGLENDVKKQNVLKSLVASKEENVEKMRFYFEQYKKSHCLYYVTANSGNGYSDAFNKAKCELADILLYERNLQEITNMAKSDIKE